MGKKNTKKALEDETDKLMYKILNEGVDAIIGGSPCQGNSIANQSGEGFDDSRSRLVWKMVATIRLVRPKFWLLENVPNALKRGVQRIFSRLASCGYDAEWDSISAGILGAPHERERLYVLAYPCGNGGQGCFPDKICRQPEFEKFKDIRSAQDLRDRPAIFGRLICRSYPGLAKRLHGIGNGNPPGIIREITKLLK